MSNLIVAQLLFLESENPTKTFTFILIPRRGGHRRAGDLRHHAVHQARCEHGLYRPGGQHGRIAAHRRRQGKRFCLPHARMMVHQPLGGFQGQATDIEIHAREILRVRERLNTIMVKHTGRTMEQIEQDTDRDYFLDGTEAVNFGLIDTVIEKRT